MDARGLLRACPWLGLALAVAIAFGGAVHNGFLYDDYHLIVENPAVASHDWATLWTSAGATSRDSQGRGFRPVTLSSYAVDHLIGGGRASVFHATQLLWHALTVGLTFAVASMVGLHRATALGAALLVGLHPMQTEAAHYLSARSSVLSTVWLLVSFWTYLRWRADPAARGEWLAASLVGLAFAVWSKESAIVGLVWFAAWELVGAGSHWSSLGRRIGLHAAVAAASVAPAVTIVGATAHGTSAPTLVALASGFAVLGRHLTGWIAPWAVDPLRPAAWVAWAHPSVWWGAGAFVGLGVVAWALRRRAPVGAWGLLCGLTGLLPGLALPFVTTVAWFQPHRGYQAAVGFALCAGAMADPFVNRVAAASGAPRSRRMARLASLAVAASVVLGLIATDVEAGKRWRHEIGFWTDAVQRYPREAAYHHSLGAARLRHGDPAGAVEAWLASARLDASLPRVDFNLGLAYAGLGRRDEAIAAYERAVARDASDVKAWANLGRMLETRGETARALVAYQRALDLAPQATAVRDRIVAIEAARAGVRP